jgi:crotonobetainyl-CoA:carnitine CoA-transferase CaiB-like acyl-CoA transferase
MTPISQTRGALDGIRVLDLSRLMPGPFCTMLLGDLGADVIKVEDPTGGDWLRTTPPLRDGESVMYAALNRNKRSVTADLKSETGRADFLRLVETADVVVEGFRPGVLDRLGVGWDVIHAANPQTILASISGFGQDGPYRGRAGHDLTYLALSGVLSVIGTTRGETAIPGVQVGDLGGGAIFAAVAILAALIARQTTGEGQWCDVSITDGLVSWLSVHAAAAFDRGAAPRAGEELLTGKFPCYGIYPCSDGEITVAAIEPQFWQQLTKTLAMPELESDAYATGDRAAEVREQLSAVFREHPRAHWARVFRDVDACVEPVLTIPEALEHPQIAGRGMVLDGVTARRRPPARPGKSTKSRPGARCPLRCRHW